MKAIVEISGKQYMVTKDQELLIDRLPKKDLKKIKIEKVLLLWDDQKIKIGDPFIDKSYAEIEVLGEARGEKIQIIKHRAKKRERKKIGFVPRYSKIKILSIANSWKLKAISWWKYEDKK